MPIGDKVAGRTPVTQASRQRVNPAAFGAGVGTALTSLANGTSDFAGTLKNVSEATTLRREREENFDAEKRYIEYIGEQNRAQATRVRSSTESAAGITEQTNTALQTSSQDFLQSIPERLRPEYDNKLTTFNETAVTSAFNYEYTAGNQKFVKDVNAITNAEAASVLQGDKSAEEAFQNVVGLIEKSDLPEAEQRDLVDQSKIFLLKAEFQKEVEYAKDFRGTVEPRREGDVVAAGLLPHERGILNAISKPESNDQYDRIFNADGVERFTDFSDHPRKYNEIKHGAFAGQKSSAAGKYQFLASTWDSAVARYNKKNPNSPVTDFSPESQDRIALDYARHIYNQQVGAGELDFDQVLQSGNRDLIISMKRALWDDNGGWEGFRHMADDEFANIIMGTDGIAGGGTGTPDNPDVWNNPRYADLTFDQKNTLSNAAAKASHDRDTAAAAAATNQRNAVTEQVMIGATQGEYTLADVNQLVQQGQLQDSADITKFQGLVERANKGQAELTRIQTALSGNGLLFEDSDNKGLNLYIGEEGVAALRSLDQEYAAQQFLPIAGRAGFIPSESGRLLSDMVTGQDRRASDFAIGVLSNAASADPRILERSSGISEDAVKQVRLTNQLRGLYTAEEVSERLRAVNDPRQSAAMNNIRQEGKKVFSDNFTVDDVLKNFDSFLPGDAASAPLFVGQVESLRQDYQTAFVEGYLISGDKNKANEYAGELIKKHWASTEIGGEKRLSKFTPETYYPTIAGSHDWLDAQVRDELDLGADASFQLVPDAQTEQEGRNYLSSEDRGTVNAPSYQIVVQGEQGYPEIKLGEDGSPIRWRGEITPKIKQRVGVASDYQNLNTRRDLLVKEMTDQALGADSPQGQQLQEIENQIDELRTNDPENDPTKVVPSTRTTDLVAQRDELIAKAEELAANPFNELTDEVNRSLVAAMETQIRYLNQRIEAR